MVGANSQARKSIRNLQAGAAAVTDLDIEGLVLQLETLLETMPNGVPRGLRVARLK